MIAPVWALLIATALLALGDLCNRRWFGFLPEDPPRPGRKQHARPMPLAGILLAPVVLPWLGAAAAAWHGAGFAALAVAIAATIGFLDDRSKEHDRDLDWRSKAIGLAAAAGAAAAAVCRPTAEPLTWLWLTAFAFVLTNAVNFLDNTDGVAASLAAVGLLAIGGGEAWPTAAGFAALAFVPWNWPRPRLFLGDAGAYALGVLLAIAIARPLQHDASALAFAAVPLVDFAQVVTARLWLGLPPWVGDRRHLTHIAHHLGVPRVMVAPLCAALALAAALAVG